MHWGVRGVCMYVCIVQIRYNTYLVIRGAEGDLDCSHGTGEVSPLQRTLPTFSFGWRLMVRGWPEEPAGSHRTHFSGVEYVDRQYLFWSLLVTISFQIVLLFSSLWPSYSQLCFAKLYFLLVDKQTLEQAKRYPVNAIWRAHSYPYFQSAHHSRLCATLCQTQYALVSAVEKRLTALQHRPSPQRLPRSIFSHQRAPHQYQEMVEPARAHNRILRADKLGAHCPPASPAPWPWRVKDSCSSNKAKFPCLRLRVIPK